MSKAGSTVKRAPCKKCSEHIPETASRCPHCGHEPGEVSAAEWASALLTFFLLSAVLWVLFHPLLGILSFIGLSFLMMLSAAVSELRDMGPTTHG